jgi:hypothetical protein
MKNFNETRSKIKNYLNALNQRFSTNEWKEYHSNEFCREFGVSVILPQLLKKEGYYYYQNKDSVPYVMLSHKVANLNEATLHNKLLEFCRNSYKKAQKKVQKTKQKQEKQKQFVGYKNITIQVTMDFYEKILIESEKKNTNVTQWILSKLVGDDKKFTIDNVKPPKKLGRPPLKRESLVETTKIETPKQERINIKTIEPIESKIKSLETIMSLFTKDLINKKELEILSNAVLSIQS